MLKNENISDIILVMIVKNVRKKRIKNEYKITRERKN